MCKTKENEEKKNFKFYKFIGVLEKKNYLVVKSVGLLPKCIVKKKKFVLQTWFCIARERAGKFFFSENCIAIPFLYCRKCQIVL